jgi:hypothetical protein
LFNNRNEVKLIPLDVVFFFCCFSILGLKMAEAKIGAKASPKGKRRKKSKSFFRTFWKNYATKNNL